MKRAIASFTYANVMATAAVFIALGAGAYAIGLPRASVGTRELKRGAVTTSRLAPGAVTSTAIRDHSLRVVDFARNQLPTGARGPQGLQGVQGLRGLQGVPGPGVSLVTVRSATSSMATNSSTVDCLPGEKVLGGGYNGMDTGHAFASHPSPVDETPMGWHAESTSATDVVTVYVLCGSG